MEPIILISAAVLGLGAVVTTYWHAQQQHSDHPIKWSVIVGVTFLLSPLVVDEVVFYVWWMVMDMYYPLYYLGAVFGIALGISAVVTRRYYQSVTTVS